MDALTRGYAPGYDVLPLRGDCPPCKPSHTAPERTPHCVGAAEAAPTDFLLGQPARSPSQKGKGCPLGGRKAFRRVLLGPRRPLSGAAQKRKLCALCVSVVL